MSEWKKVKLGDYIDVLSGFAYKSKDFSDSGIPVIKIKNVCPPYISLEDLSYVPNSIAFQNPRYILKKGDVLIAMTGSHINQIASVVGRVGRVRYDDVTVLNQRVGKIVNKDDSLSCLDFIYYYLSQYDVKVELAQKAGGAANQANISPSDIKNLMIPCPPLEVQHRIATILSRYDSLIENYQKQIKLLEEAVQRLYKEWFVDLHFPGHENTKIVDGVPEGWTPSKLGQLAEFKRGKTITKKDAVEGTIPVVAGGLEPAYYCNRSNTAERVITVSGSGANAGFTRMYFERVWASDCSFVDASTTPFLHFVYCYLKDNKTTIDNMQKGAAQPHVYAKDINSLEISIPVESILKSFEKNVSKYFDTISSLQSQIRLLTEARDRLLPRLMSGDIKV
ncbi:MAG: restriction endonuclease subunit S [Prevotella sp.]|nr:restriction endonuclease subunit S [Prevotella sp.]